MSEYLMNTASVLYVVCYLPEFYANYENKNANIYNVFEKIIMLTACSCALSYSISINNKALIINYAPALTLDITALIMRSYYAYNNRNRSVKVIYNQNVEKMNDTNITNMNPIHYENSVESLEDIL